MTKIYYPETLNYCRLGLDLPFRLGFAHLKVSLGIDNKIYKVSKEILNNKNILYIEQINLGPLKLRKKIQHFFLGFVELIPLINIIVTLKKEIFGSKFINNIIYSNTEKPSITPRPLPPKSLDSHLIVSNQKIEPHQYSWYLNLALLKSVYEKANESQKEQIKFLAVNFLSIATPKNLSSLKKNMESIDPNFLHKYQSTPLEQGSHYYRECLLGQAEHGKKYNQRLAYGTDSLFIPTDTRDLSHLFPLKFTLIDHHTQAKDYAFIIKNTLHKHCLKNLDVPLSQPLELPFLLDVSYLLKQNIQTNNDKDAEEKFIEEFKNFKEQFDCTIDNGIKQLLQEYPHLNKNENDLKNFVNNNISCISCIEVDSITGIKMLPIGSNSSKWNQFQSPFTTFITRNGLYIGMVNCNRKLTDDVFQQYSDINYAISPIVGTNLVYYPHKEDFTKSALFQRLLCLFGSQSIPTNDYCGIHPMQLNARIEAIAKKPHLKVFGQAIVNLLQGLFIETDDKKWKKLNQDPITSEILQTTLFLVNTQLATLEQMALSDRFNEFSQVIEVLNAELAILLELFQPFQIEDFGEIYKKELSGKSVPLEMSSFIKAGLGKTSVNVFAGIIAALQQKGIPINGIYSHGTYFEQTLNMQDHFDAFINNPSLPKCDLYFTQTNATIGISSEVTEYVPRDVASDIRKLLDENRVTENFTVAVDITMDDFYSDDVKKLLSKFQNEIEKGKINFIFCSSGQKFYMMGMDNYYGSNFYMVNNEDEKWKIFDSIFTHSAYRIDPLSAQWFCLATKYASSSLATYRRLIFDNTRYILDHLSESFTPKLNCNQKVRVNKVDSAMVPCYVDLKVVAPATKQAKKADKIKRLFYEKMAKKDITPFTRGSFGFFHPNFSVWGDLDPHVRTIRFNPGINPEENDKIVEFFNKFVPAF